MKAVNNRYNFLAILLGLSAPLILAVGNSSWLYTPIGYLDPWYYIGYAFHYNDPGFLNGYYKISRLPWILAEYSFHKIFPPLIANSVLQFGCLFLATTSIFIVLKRFFGNTPAIFSVIFLGVYVHFHGSGGADYHNTIAGPLYALAFLCLTFASLDGRDLKKYFLFGAIYVASVHANILYINMAPAMLMHLFFIKKTSDNLDFLPLTLIIGIAFAGGVFSTCLLGLINLSFGRDFLFFLLQFKAASTFVGDASTLKAWWNPWSNGWYLQAYWLVAVIATGIACLVNCLIIFVKKDFQSNRSLYSLSLSLQFLLLLSLWLMWQSLGQVALDWNYFAAPLIVPMILAIGGIWGIYGPQFSGYRLILFSMCSVIVFIVPLWFPDLFIKLILKSEMQLIRVSLILYLLGFIALFIKANFKARAIFVVAFFSMGNILANNSPAQYRIINANCNFSRDVYISILEAHKKLLKYQSNPQKVYVWFDVDETSSYINCPGNYQLNNYGMSLAFTGFKILGDPWPVKSIEKLNGESMTAALTSDGVVAIISNNSITASKLLRKINYNGQGASIIAIEDIGQEAVSLRMFLIKNN